jgi:hypothetical protein
MRRSIIFITVVFLFPCLCRAQVETPSTTSEQQLENITENNEDQETEDDSYLQEMVQFQKDPLNLNTADEMLLKELRMLTPVQVQNLLSYRMLLGKFVNIYELQAIPSWDIQTIRRLRPYVTVSNDIKVGATLATRLREGDHTVLLRISQVVERSKGFLLDSIKAANYYMGSPQRLLVRYKYNYKNVLQYGVVGEKDAGEQFFKGGQRNGFDFYSAHFFLRDMGIIKSLALGDFTVNMGQGLVQWQSLAFKKGPDVLSTKRQAAVLRPYSSAGEINFHRGVGITLGKNNWEATVFGSIRTIDANFVTDTLETTADFISSLQVSGYHRTPSELQDKNSQRQLAFGGNVSWKYRQLHVGINGIRYHFKYPLQKDDQPYNRLALSGNDIGNYSIDYGYTYKNMHFFGEAASSNKKELAFVSGLLISTSANIDMSFLYRNIAPGYQALYANAFTESTFPSNEKGLFSGISIKPSSQWQIDAYADMYKFPGIKFRVNAPTAGSDYLVQLQYRPNKVFEVYTRYKRESKGINFNPDGMVLSPVIYQPRQNWRTQVSYKFSPAVTLRNRAEIVWFDKKSAMAGQGFLLYGDLLYKPLMKRYSGNMRLLYFETDGYNSRLYAFENDVLYSFAIPVFYDKGYRYYLNFNYDVGKRLTVWAKVGQTVYKEKNTVGTGLDEIQGNRKTDVKFQVQYKF